MLKLFRVLAVILLTGLVSCAKTVETQIQKYLEFYFPSSGTYYYQIDFDWGTYTIERITSRQ